MIGIIITLGCLVIIIGIWLGGEQARNRKLRAVLKHAESKLAVSNTAVDYWKGSCEHEAGERRKTQRVVAEKAARIMVLEKRLAVLPSRGVGGRFVTRVGR